jgi:NDP-sugar pyrophosphorylase family protein
VVADDDDRVVGFQEKPPLEEARSRMCNCGIYVFEPAILSHILPGEFDDFGRRVFPDLLKQRIPFHIQSVAGYWSDVGNLGEYVRGNADALEGLVELEIPGKEIRPEVWVEADATVPSTARIEPPVAIGRGAVLGENVVVEGPAVIGEASVLEAGSHVARSLLLPGSRIPVGSLVVDGVVGRSSSTQEDGG